jgi:hypothetical protein
MQALDHFLDEQGALTPANSDATVELPRRTRLERVESRVQLALVVDQLEELFVGGFSPELQQRYIAALGAALWLNGGSFLASPCYGAISMRLFRNVAAQRIPLS